MVAALFCAPLFVGLGGWDLRSDEAIYSYAVDRIIETGDWLTPRSIQVDGPFLEKPPLKFWLVAALIRAGVVPQDEFGYRFVDALMGAAAFLYIYLFGLRLSGVVCGMAAVFVTFLMDSLVFEHGIRSNNMEAPLLLGYCGGLYHFMRWADGASRPRAHALAVGAYFALAFMMKFVAALFLPIICVVTIAIAAEARARLIARRHDWLWPAALSVAAIAPWFLYETMVYGRAFWNTILGVHVYTRFTGALDPNHLQPWHFYFTRTFAEFGSSDGRVRLIAGLLVLLAGAWRGRPWQMRLLLAWWLVPFALISIGTSKLYHYAYPFLPPIALGAGWLAGWVMHAAEGPAGAALERQLARVRFKSTVVRTTLAIVAVIAIGLAIATAVQGQIVWRIAGVKILQNSSLLRPLMVAAALTSLAGLTTVSVRVVGVLVLALVVPAEVYAIRLDRVTTLDHRLSALRDCAVNVHDLDPGGASGIYNAARGDTNHSHYFYFYRLGPWEEPERASADEVRARLFTPRHQTPVLMTTSVYAAWRQELAAEQPPLAIPPAAVIDSVAIVTPGPYHPCAAAAIAAGATRPRAAGEDTP